MNKLRSLKRPFTVIVEGNIGSGKTRFLNHYDKLHGNVVSTRPEPLNDWQNCNGHNLLQLLYKDIEKWSFAFQSYVQLTMLKEHISPADDEKPIKLMERSIYSARYCFVENMNRCNLLQPLQSINVLDKWFRWIIDNKLAEIDLIVYIRTEPEVAYERLMTRGRKEESTIAFEYLKDLHKLHELWLYQKTLHNCPAPVLVLDGNLNGSEMDAEYKRSEPHILIGRGTEKTAAAN